MLYAYTEHLFGIKSLYQCTETEAFAIACEIGEGCWCFDIGKNKAGEYVLLPYRYWHAID